jgi:hypothetical protein
MKVPGPFPHRIPLIIPLEGTVSLMGVIGVMKERKHPCLMILKVRGNRIGGRIIFTNGVVRGGKLIYRTVQIGGIVE